MKTRILTAILIIAVVFYPVAFGGVALQILGAALVLAGSYEWIHGMEGFKNWGWLVLIPAAAFLLVLPYIPFQYLLAYCACGLIFFWSLPIFVASCSQEDAMNTIAFLVIMGLCYLSIQQVYAHHEYLWTLCFATYGSDSGAYFAGRAFGKHKMIERISPKKTWEGFFGGWAAGFLLSFALSFFYVSSLNWTVNLLLCILSPVFAELGDLCFSSYKRAHGLKDFSSLLPGHGGVLDRVDSLLMNILLFGIIITIL